jgi:hypothetical protein
MVVFQSQSALENAIFDYVRKYLVLDKRLDPSVA